MSDEIIANEKVQIEDKIIYPESITEKIIEKIKSAVKIPQNKKRDIEAFGKTVHDKDLSQLIKSRFQQSLDKLNHLDTKDIAFSELKEIISKHNNQEYMKTYLNLLSGYNINYTNTAKEIQVILLGYFSKIYKETIIDGSWKKYLDILYNFMSKEDNNSIQKACSVSFLELYINVFSETDLEKTINYIFEPLLSWTHSKKSKSLNIGASQCINDLICYLKEKEKTSIIETLQQPFFNSFFKSTNESHFSVETVNCFLESIDFSKFIDNLNKIIEKIIFFIDISKNYLTKIACCQTFQIIAKNLKCFPDKNQALKFKTLDISKIKLYTQDRFHKVQIEANEAVFLWNDYLQYCEKGEGIQEQAKGNKSTERIGKFDLLRNLSKLNKKKSVSPDFDRENVYTKGISALLKTTSFMKSRENSLNYINQRLKPPKNANDVNNQGFITFLKKIKKNKLNNSNKDLQVEVLFKSNHNKNSNPELLEQKIDDLGKPLTNKLKIDCSLNKETNELKKTFDNKNEFENENDQIIDIQNHEKIVLDINNKGFEGENQNEDNSKGNTLNNKFVFEEEEFGADNCEVIQEGNMEFNPNEEENLGDQQENDNNNVENKNGDQGENLELNQEEIQEEDQDNNQEEIQPENHNDNKDDNQEVNQDDNQEDMQAENQNDNQEGNQYDNQEGNQEVNQHDNQEGNQEVNQDDNQEVNQDDNQEVNQDDNQEVNQDDNQENKKIISNSLEDEYMTIKNTNFNQTVKIIETTPDNTKNIKKLKKENDDKLVDLKSDSNSNGNFFNESKQNLSPVQIKLSTSKVQKINSILKPGLSEKSIKNQVEISSHENFIDLNDSHPKTNKRKITEITNKSQDFSGNNFENKSNSFSSKENLKNNLKKLDAKPNLGISGTKKEKIPSEKPNPVKKLNENLKFHKDCKSETENEISPNLEINTKRVINIDKLKVFNDIKSSFDMLNKYLDKSEKSFQDKISSMKANIQNLENKISKINLKTKSKYTHKNDPPREKIQQPNNFNQNLNDDQMSRDNIKMKNDKNIEKKSDIWEKINENLKENQQENAYRLALINGDDLVLIRLINTTGNILDKLSFDTCQKLIGRVCLIDQSKFFNRITNGIINQAYELNILDNLDEEFQNNILETLYQHFSKDNEIVSCDSQELYQRILSKFSQ